MRCSVPFTFAVAVLFGLLAACSPTAATSGVATSAAYESATAIADSLDEGGVPCGDISSRPAGAAGIDEVRCTIERDDVIIRVFPSSDARDQFMEASGGFAEQISFDVEAPPRVVGPTWIVTTDTRATAEKIRAVLGGELR